MAKIRFVGGSITGARVGVSLGGDSEGEFYGTKIASNEIGILAHGRESLAKQLGLADLPPETWGRFIDALKSGTETKTAAAQSGLAKFLIDHGIELGSLLTNIATLVATASK